MRRRRSEDRPETPCPPVPVDMDRLRRDETTVEAGFWDKVRATLGRVPFSEDAVTAFFAARDPATPLYVKAILLGALAYFIAPADAVPDLIPGLGFTDDAAVLAAALGALVEHMKPRHREAARVALRRVPEGPEDA